MTVDALVLAGGETGAAFGARCEERYEALIPIAGRPMVAWVVEALTHSKLVGKVWVVGPTAELEKICFPETVTVVPGGDSLLTSVQHGLSVIQPKGKILLATGDIPFLTAAAVQHFLTVCAPLSADLYYPVIAKKTVDQAYPGNRRTYVRLKDGIFTGGNLLLIDPDIVPRCLEQARYIVANRKHPFKLCRFLGIFFLFRFLWGNLSLKAIAERVETILNIQGSVVCSPFPEIGMDVDKPADLELVRNWFLQKNR